MASKSKKPVQMVNIPRSVTDDFYRYKMPVLIAKVEGRGNGIKTVLVNISDVAKALNRPASFPTKYMGFVLGALTLLDPQSDRYVVNGKHDQPRLAALLDDFVERYVLCRTCRNPETQLAVARGAIELRCKACGAVTQCAAVDKMGQYIVKNPPPLSEEELRARREKKERRLEEERQLRRTQEDLQRMAAARNADQQQQQQQQPSRAKSPAAAASKKAAAAAAAAEDDGEEWSADVSKEAMAARLADMLGTAADSKALADVVRSSSSRSPPPPQQTAKIEADVAAACAAHSGDGDEAALRAELARVFEAAGKQAPADFVRAVYAAKMASDVARLAAKHAALLAVAAQAAGAGDALLGCLAESLAQQKLARQHVPGVLNALYTADALEEDGILAWVSAHASSDLAAAAAPFVQWLQTAEEEEEEEDN